MHAMKQCPRCGREYDNTMAFCLDDGAELLYGPASAGEASTAILSESPHVGTSAGGQVDAENPTRPFIYTTAAEAEPTGSLGHAAQKWSFSARRAARPLAALVVA